MEEEINPDTKGHGEEVPTTVVDLLLVEYG
jgi:hypothetical protein